MADEKNKTAPMDKMDKILWNVWLQGIYRESGKPHLAVTRADSDERYMRLLGQVTTDPNDYRDRCKISDPPEVMAFIMVGAAWAAAHDKWLASGGDRISKQAVIDILKKNDPNAYELRLIDKLERELATA